jgi:hypothetical protein
MLKPLQYRVTGKLIRVVIWLYLLTGMSYCYHSFTVLKLIYCHLVSDFNMGPRI